MERKQSDKPFLVGKIEARKKYLAVEIDEIQEHISKISRQVDRFQEDCDKIVDLAVANKTSFGESSLRLGRIDDHITIIRSLIGSVNSGIFGDLIFKGDEFGEMMTTSSDFLLGKIERRAWGVKLDGQALLKEVEVLKGHISKLLKGLDVRDTLDQETLSRVYMEVSKKVAEKELQVAQVWEGLADWKDVLDLGAGREICIERF